MQQIGIRLVDADGRAARQDVAQGHERRAGLKLLDGRVIGKKLEVPIVLRGELLESPIQGLTPASKDRAFRRSHQMKIWIVSVRCKACRDAC
jgi:hypothetical protein